MALPKLCKVAILNIPVRSLYTHNITAQYLSFHGKDAVHKELSMQNAFSDEYKNMLETALSTSDGQCLIFNTKGSCLYRKSTENTSTLEEAARRLISSGKLPDCTAPGCAVSNCTASNCTGSGSMADCGCFFLQAEQHRFYAHVYYAGGPASPYYIFHIRETRIPASYSKYGLLALDRLQAELSCTEPFCGNMELMLRFFADHCPASRHITAGNLMIAGEIGTGRDALAQLLYLRSSTADKPLYLINCSLLSERSWMFLLGSDNSPLADKHQNLYFANLNTLSQERQKELLAYILGTNLHARSRLMFSCEKRADDELPHIAMEYANMLGLSILPIRPLRSARADIAALAEHFAAVLCPESRLSGDCYFSREAAQLINDFNWPYNLTQLKRVVREAFHAQKKPVSPEAVHAALLKESGFSGQTSANSSAPLYAMDIQIDRHKSLAEISREIALYVLKESGGNRTLAARSLGISRTTLWRLIRSTGSEEASDC